MKIVTLVEFVSFTLKPKPHLGVLARGSERYAHKLYAALRRRRFLLGAASRRRRLGAGMIAATLSLPAIISATIS
jgi:hypothetical protein